MGVRVSVIIPTWNRAAAVVEAVGDVLRQTETDFEVLVCDDGSTDESRARLAAIADEQRLALYESYRRWWKESGKRPSLSHRLLVAARCFRSRGRLRAAARGTPAPGSPR